MQQPASIVACDQAAPRHCPGPQSHWKRDEALGLVDEQPDTVEKIYSCALFSETREWRNRRVQSSSYGVSGYKAEDGARHGIE